jgi:hypothetical protein
MRALATLAVTLAALGASGRARAQEPPTPAAPALDPAPAARALPAAPPQPASGGAKPAKPAKPAEPVGDTAGERVEFDFELKPYYSSVSVFFALTDEPIPHIGEKDELEMYLALLPRALDPRQFIPRFIVLEASVNPLPLAGLVVRDRWPGFYDDAQVSERLNWVKALTTGFEEPWAVSILGGQFVNFDVPGSKDVKGKGYGGLLVSFGTHHIKDNLLYRDNWVEIESKVKGDRKSPVKKLTWSFRVGAKIHDNPNIADIVYLGLRRGRLDYVEHPDLVFSNWGFEYRFDVVVDRIAADGLRQARHVLLVDKKFLIPKIRWALTLKGGFVYTLADAYRGPLARTNGGEDFQFVLRPNVEF